MVLKLTKEERDFYFNELSYSECRAKRAALEYRSWNASAEMEDDIDLSISYSARAELAFSEQLFWESQARHIKSMLNMI